MIRKDLCDNVKIEACKLQTGDILITKSSGSNDLVGKSSLFIDPNDGNTYLFSNFTLRLRPDQSKVLPEFLAWFLRSPQSLMWRYETQQTTVGLRNLKTKEFLSQIIPVPDFDVQKSIITYFNAIETRDILAMKIDLPPSLEVQRRIVARIEGLAARIEEAQKLRRQAAEEAEVLLAVALKNMREKLLINNHPKEHIGKITQVTSGGTPLRDVSSYWGGEIPWIKTGELIDRDIHEAEEYITQEGLNNSSAKLFPIDTILIALYGQGQTRGRTGRLMIEATTNQACCAILPTPTILDPRFTQYWLRSLYTEMRETSRDGAQPNWNGKMIKNIKIALPPLDEQRSIVAHLDELQAKVDALKKYQAQTAEELDALLPSVLDRAFRGEL